MTRQELIDIVTQELASIEGGWQSLELRIVKAKHSAQLLVDKLLEKGHLQADDEAGPQS